ncbi:rhamnosyltransferase [Tenuifilaceae bacterium CYCD]|nr:rhamnosyltransferase [Tenuifilaceae bacterium CYCD]
MDTKLKKVAIIGTNGIPARYGGYETLADYLTKYLNGKVDFTVYCSSIYSKNERRKKYNDSKLIYIPIKANGIQSIFYDIISTFHAWFTSDVLLILGPAAGFILPLNFIFRKKIIINHGGLDEWKREKYSKFEKLILKINRYISGKFASVHISDNELLRNSLKETFNINAVVIEYGGDHVCKKNINSNILSKYPFLSGEYYLNVSRAQIDNNIHVVLDAFKEMPERKIVVLSNWNISEYGKSLKSRFGNYSNIFLVDAVYDKDELDTIRSNTKLYIHSHSRCGTAPSLVEAMSYEIPIICFDVPVNRLTTMNKSYYFSDSLTLIEVIKNLNSKSFDDLKNEMYLIASSSYTWDVISNKYLSLFIK